MAVALAGGTRNGEDSPRGFRLDGAMVPGDVLYVKGQGGLMELGTAGGFLGHVMVVVEVPERISANSELAHFLEPIWPTDGAREIWKVRTAEATRSNAGLHECDLLLRVDCKSQQLILIGEFGNGQVDFSNEVLELWQCPRSLRAQISHELIESVIDEMREQATSWSWNTAVRAVFRNPECLTDTTDKQQLLREIVQCWTSDPICTSIVICFWQRCLCKFAEATNACTPKGVPRIEAVDLILQWMPLKADRSLPGILLETMRRCGWIRKNTMRAGAEIESDLDQVFVLGHAPAHAPAVSSQAKPAPPSRQNSMLQQAPPQQPAPQQLPKPPPNQAGQFAPPQRNQPNQPVAPRFCCAHNSSEKRVKCAPVSRQCPCCHMPVQTTYADMAMCPPCSEKKQCCMICGAGAEMRGDYVPPTHLDRPAAVADHMDTPLNRVKVDYSHKATEAPRAEKQVTVEDSMQMTVGGPAGGLMPAVPLAPSQVPPRYCQAHNSSEKRVKTAPRFLECPSCHTAVQTTYANFAMCPPCSERKKQCMICGVGAHNPGSFHPAAHPAAPARVPAPIPEDFSQKDFSQVEASPAPPTPVPPITPMSLKGNQGVSPRYCSNHDTRKKRTKVDPRMLECQACQIRIQTNTADFTYCPQCSDHMDKCMICGAHAPGAPAPAELPQINEESVLASPAPSTVVPPRYCSAHDTRSKRPKGEPRFRECGSCLMIIQTNCVDFSLCPSCSQRQHQCMICGNSAPGPIGSSCQAPSLENTTAFDPHQVQEPPVLPRGPPTDMSFLEVTRFGEDFAPKSPRDVRPRYCRAHEQKEKRLKVRPRQRVCVSCKTEVRTNCAEFALCPACSQNNEQCMICAASAPDPGPAQTPLAMSPSQRLPFGGDTTPVAMGQQEAQLPPQLKAFRPTAAGEAAVAMTPAPAAGTRRYCQLHESRERRLKVEPRLEECKSCRAQIQTNCAEFALCPGCSESQQRCMICAATTRDHPEAQAFGQLSAGQTGTRYPLDNAPAVRAS